MPTREETLELLSGVIGDKYEVLQWIGGGGMAEVFQARHRGHGGLFAVKVLADHLARDPAIVGRFLQEARTAATLSGHPNIVSIFDIGAGSGLHYLIMQYVDGEDFSSYLERKGNLSPLEAVQVVTQVTKALVWAHSKGVIHRDLKPANVRLDPYGRVVVLDFGIAKASDAPSALTSMGERLGTPYYMSPEQIRGETCDHRSDLYSLGILFFELLTGKTPFSGENYRAIEYAQLFSPAPSPGDFVPSIGAEYCQIVRRLLEKVPAARYQSAAELHDELKVLRSGSGTTELRPLTQEQIAAAAREAGPAPPELEKTRADATVRRVAAPEERLPAAVGKKKSNLVLGGIAATILCALGVNLYLARTSGSGPTAGTETAGPVLPSRIDMPTGAMVLVPAGAFLFGEASRESANPPQPVSLPDFYVDAGEVSNAAYNQFCNATGLPPPEAPPWDAGYFLGKPNHPVVNVSLEEGKAFAEWAGKRLPTEQEWEKAARGSDGRIFPWGGSAPVREANLGGAADGYEHSAPVDAFSQGASPYGARNMAGNVWEWTITSYPATEQELADLQAHMPGAGKQWSVIKGGSFAPRTDELWLRAYMRRGFPVTGRSPFIGFRCVKNAK